MGPSIVIKLNDSFAVCVVMWNLFIPGIDGGIILIFLGFIRFGFERLVFINTIFLSFSSLSLSLSFTSKYFVCVVFLVYGLFFKCYL
jgi:hypothetical protein